jgi:hypothetical protein
MKWTADEAFFFPHQLHTPLLSVFGRLIGHSIRRVTVMKLQRLLRGSYVSDKHIMVDSLMQSERRIGASQ